MSLLESAKRVAGEFDYPAEDVNKGVAEFLRQMGTFSMCCGRLYNRLIERHRRGFGKDRSDNVANTNICHRSTEWDRKGQHDHSQISTQANMQ